MDNGITIGLAYRGELVGNASGGTSRQASEVGELFLGGRFDTGKRTRWKGGLLSALVTKRAGPSVTAKAGLDLLLNAQELYGAGRVFRLTELSLQQTFAGGRLVVKAGRFGNETFASMDCDFTNLTLCGPPPASLVTSYWSISPIGTWTSWLKIGSSGKYVRLGVGEDNRHNADQGFFISKGGAKGVLLNGEAGITPHWLGPNRPSLFRLGGLYTSSCDPDLLPSTRDSMRALQFVAPSLRCGQGGGWIEAQQEVTGRARQDPVSGRIFRENGLEVFASYFHADNRTANLLETRTGGLYYSGIGRRQQDLIAIGFGQTVYNSRADRANQVADPASLPRGTETISEIFYGFHIQPGTVLKPGLQYIHAPGGVQAHSGVLALGLRLDVAF